MYFTTSGIITLCGWTSSERDGHLQCVMIPDVVKYNFDLLMITMMMITWCSKHVEECNKFVIKQEFVHWVGQLLRL